MARRVLDIAGVSPPFVNVWLNSRQVPITNFLNYFKLFQPELRKIEKLGGADDEDESDAEED